MGNSSLPGTQETYKERILEFPSLSFLFWLLFIMDPKLGIVADLLQS